RQPSPPLFPYTTLFRSEPFELPMGRGEDAAQFRERYRLRIEHDRAVAIDVDRAALLHLAQPSDAADLGHRQIDFSLDLGKPRAEDRKSTRLNSSHDQIS